MLLIWENTITLPSEHVLSPWQRARPAAAAGRSHWAGSRTEPADGKWHISFQTTFCVIHFPCLFYSLTVMICALSSGERVAAFGFPLNSLWKDCMALAVTSYGQKNSSHVKHYIFVSMIRTTTYACFWALTTWLSVITRSRVSQQDLTAPRGNVPINSFRRPSTWRVVVSSLLPGGVRNILKLQYTGQFQKNILNYLISHNKKTNYVCLTSCLFHFFHAELGCGSCCRVMGRGIISKQEVATSENGADSLLCSFTDLGATMDRKWNVK